MEWRGSGDQDPNRDSARSFSAVHPHQQSALSHPSDGTTPSLCQRQQHCVKASVISSWRLAEAQDQLCSLGVHSSESLEQEQARMSACPTEHTYTEEEWRRKESMLGGEQDSNRSPVLGTVGSWDVFNKSIINVQFQPIEMEQDTCKTFLQKYETELRRFGMLRRWDDSQRFLSALPQLICEDTANYLILWCIRLQQEGKEALMDQVAHQAVAMQFILEMASNSQQDPRGCFRQFFHKAKARQNVYLEVFHTEHEAFKMRVREHALRSKADAAKDGGQQSTGTHTHRLEPKEALDSFTPVAEYTTKRCLEAGLWTNTGRWTKDETTETDDISVMETS
ncbi:hsp90 co-chaperone Cdc37-like 1 [Genypterus blacodes]|uniref:hsp90 co-chaperone Cdc37-like 1 n=1 Tax=Genypterus blacodes TaxID=154954 RepID=UPI003F7775C2